MRQQTVAIADLAVVTDETLLVTTGVGSCVAIALHDATGRIGGLAHVLLPHAALSSLSPRVGKFPSTAVPAMLAQMRELGSTGEIHARLIGGASMFAPLLAAGSVGLGVRNLRAARQACADHAVPIVGEAVGGNMARSVYFNVATGAVQVRSVRGPHVEL
ncbi:chemotaxis protein CheD [Gemmatimonas sp.]|jgi:chemotaxis protein CheD|uniref:chemotaxis protein CheD n=1 Tax=Gemmatimonas sp. TaxID=1962908 RepID=UPI0037BE2B45